MKDTTLLRHQPQGIQPLYGGGSPGHLQGAILNEIQGKERKKYASTLWPTFVLLKTSTSYIAVGNLSNETKNISQLEGKNNIGQTDLNLFLQGSFCFLLFTGLIVLQNCS